MPAPPATCLVTNEGKAITAKALKGGGGFSAPSTVFWGIGVGTADVTDTWLFQQSPDGEGYGTGTMSVVTTSVPNDTWRVVSPALPVVANPKAITEVMTENSLGTIHVHANFPAINLAVGDAVGFTIEVQFL